MIMMNMFRSVLLTFLICPLYANAWFAVAHSPSQGHIQLISEGISKDITVADAISACNTSAKSNDCNLLLSCDGPSALVIFRGEGGVVATCNPEPKIAYKNAQESCSNKYENCRPVSDLIIWDEGTSLMVMAYSKDNAPKKFAAFQKDFDSASVKLLDSCKQEYPESECHHTEFASKKWWVVEAYDNQDKLVGNGLSTTSKKEALEYAHNQCLQQGVRIENCKFKYFEKPHNPAPKSFSDIAKIVKKDLAAYDTQKNKVKNNTVVANKANCRPNTPTVRCHSNCANGNCVVTYENGCKMTVQVQPKLNPFTNQFEFPSPSC